MTNCAVILQLICKSKQWSIKMQDEMNVCVIIMSSVLQTVFKKKNKKQS